MLTNIHLCPNHARRVKRYSRLRFLKGLNLLIGPNGTGKSTVLRAIAACSDCKRLQDGKTDYVLFDTENMNPHLSNAAADYNTNTVLRTRAMFSSHGQTLQDVYSTLRVSPHTCLLLDEPESGQDVEHILSLRKAMDRAVARGAQVICATHHVLFWSCAHVIELRRGYRERVRRTMLQTISELENQSNPSPVKG